MAREFPSVQQFSKLDWGQKYTVLKSARRIAESRYKHYTQFKKGNVPWAENVMSGGKGRKQINKNYYRVYDKLATEVGIYKRGVFKGQLKQPTSSMSNRELLTMYQSYSTFLKADIYSPEGKKVREEIAEKAIKTIMSDENFVGTKQGVKNLYNFYNRVGKELISQYGSEEVKDIFNQYQSLDDFTIMEVMEDAVLNNTYTPEAILEVHTKLLPKIISKQMPTYQQMLDDVGYEDYDAEELVEMAINGKAPLGFDVNRYTSPKEIKKFFKDFTNTLK